MKFYHITLWDHSKQNILSPRIPDMIGAYENTDIKRISLSTSIKNCIKGIGKIDELDKDNRIRVYIVEIDVCDKNLVDWKTLYESGYVNDSFITHEYWYKNDIHSFDYQEYKVENIKTDYRLIVKNEDKDIMIKNIENHGLYIPLSIKNKTAIEILRYFEKKNSDVIEDVKNTCFKTSRIDEDIDEKIYKTIFGYAPENQCYSEPVIEKMKYIDSCNIRLIV